MKYTIIRERPYYKGVTRDMKSPTQASGKLEYVEGKTVRADGLDLDSSRDCGQGINFCHTLAQALRWGPVVIEVVPIGQIVDTGDKLRSKAVRVLRIADLSGANLSGAYLSKAYLLGADLLGADLSGANLSGANLSEAKADAKTLLPAHCVLANGRIEVSQC